MTERVCQHCGVSIEGKRSDALFCGSRCSKAKRLSIPEIRIKYKEGQAASIEKNRDHYRKYHREWIKRNSEKVAQYSKNYRRNNQKKLNAYYEINKTKIIERAAKWNRENPEAIARIARRYYRQKAAATHFQEITAAAEAFMASLQNQEKTE